MNTTELRKLAGYERTYRREEAASTIEKAADEIDRLTAERDAALASEAVYKQLCEEAKPLIAQNIVLRAERAALAAQEPVALLAQGISGGIVGAERLYFPQERNEAIEFCAAAHEKGGYPVTEISPLYAAAGAAPVPEGWQLVPVEPTQEMLDAADHGNWQGGLECQYRNMLEAVPKEPS